MPNGNHRGNSYDRARRRQYLLDTFGDGTTAKCSHCSETLTNDTITVDRIVPGRDGGRYVRENIQPSCFPCACAQGGRLGGRISGRGRPKRSEQVNFEEKRSAMLQAMSDRLDALAQHGEQSPEYQDAHKAYQEAKKVYREARVAR